MKKNAILAIDMQKSFVSVNGELSVAGAEDDAKRIAEFINRNQKNIHGITLTMDSHYPHHIAHPVFWQDKDGNHPTPFTTITLQDIKDGKWTSTYAPQWISHYVEELEKLGKTLTIWNEHCLVGSTGWSLDDTVMAAVLDWSRSNGKPYRMEFKGSNVMSEHYSVFKAEVQVPNCPETQLNQTLLNTLNTFDVIYLVGEAQNYCVENSLADICTYAPDLVAKMVILDDCMSPIGPFDINTDPVYQKAVSLGAKIAKSTDITL